MSRALATLQLLGTPAGLRLSAVLGLLAGILLASALPARSQDGPAEGADRPLVLVLDASGSMDGLLAGERKIRVARAVVETLLEDWNPAIQLGLTVYGHRRERDCSDIEPLIAPGSPSSRNSAAILAAIDEVKPKGKTPIAAALQHAARTLSFEEPPPPCCW